MNAGRFKVAYRLGLALALACGLWFLIPRVMSYSAQRNKLSAADLGTKLSAADLVSQLKQHKQFARRSQLHCERAVRDWDYVCSYMPTPLHSKTRLQFGIEVDSTRWVQVSRAVPMGTIVPSPQ
jgi:hypothetical protein